LGEVGLHPPFDILPESVEAILILAGALEPGSGGEEDADPSTADEVESLGMGNFVEETQDGAAKVGRRRGHGILERVKGHRRGPSDRWNKDQEPILWSGLGGIILPTGRACLSQEARSGGTGRRKWIALRLRVPYTTVSQIRAVNDRTVVYRVDGCLRVIS